MNAPGRGQPPSKRLDVGGRPSVRRSPGCAGLRRVATVGVVRDDGLATEVVELLGRMVACATESRTSNEALLDIVAGHLGQARVRYVSTAGDEGRANLIASIGPDVAGGLLLAGHTDVVPAGAGWATNPYRLDERAGRFYGRGTADMKGFLAVALHVLGQIDPATLTRPIHLLASYDEEIGCRGIRHALPAAAGLEPALVIVGEPTMLRPALRHAGKVSFDVVVRTRSAHSSKARTERSAITVAAAIIGNLADVQRANDGVTVNLGSITGGSLVNVIADRCEFSFELRHAADIEPDALLVPVFAVVQAHRLDIAAIEGRIEMREVSRYPGLATDSSHPLARLVERIADAGSPMSVDFGTEGGLIAAATAAPVVICGPGDISVAHRPDEYVSADQLRACQRFLTHLTDHICRS
jgi:acetylornithine deacetylase